MTTELFTKWLYHFIKHAPEERPLVLIMDQHETHCGHHVIDMSRENSTEIVLLPTHHSHAPSAGHQHFQPPEGRLQHPGQSHRPSGGDMVIGKKQFSSVLKHAHEKAVTPANIMAGFKKAGIHLLSKEAVDMMQVSFFILFPIIIHINSIMHLKSYLV